MSCHIVLHPEAEQEVATIFNWYESKSPGLGDRFLRSLSERFTELSTFPDRYAIRHLSFREVRLQIFPYIIIYEFDVEKKTVFILHLFHKKMNPSGKYRRRM